MLETTTSLMAAQAASAATPDGPSGLHTLRGAFLESLRRRNTSLDALFYDVGVVSPAEAAKVEAHRAREGSIVHVEPSGMGELTVCATLGDYLASGKQARALAVAGVGSSALGTAAFARNVADAIRAPVAGVVSGYGMADLLTEALGGYFWFGMLNGLRHGFELFDEWARPGDSIAGSGADSGTDPGADSGTSVTGPRDAVRASLDTRIVIELLLQSGLEFDLLVGHSKGNLVLSEALYALRQEHPARLRALARNTRLVTVSARIAMPRAFPRVTDIMGEWDWFGGLNSRPDIEPDLVVENAWHHTNTQLPAHLPVTRALAQVL